MVALTIISAVCLSWFVMIGVIVYKAVKERKVTIRTVAQLTQE